MGRTGQCSLLPISCWQSVAEPGICSTEYTLRQNFGDLVCSRRSALQEGIEKHCKLEICRAFVVYDKRVLATQSPYHLFMTLFRAIFYAAQNQTLAQFICSTEYTLRQNYGDLVCSRRFGLQEGVGKHSTPKIARVYKVYNQHVFATPSPFHLFMIQFQNNIQLSMGRERGSCQKVAGNVSN